MLDVVAATAGAHGHVLHVRSHGKQRPAWGRAVEVGYLQLDFAEVATLTRIALATCFCWFGQACMLQQTLGTPMGHMASPGFAKCITARASPSP